MSRVYKSCNKCGYLYDYKGYSVCPECGTVQENIRAPRDYKTCNKCQCLYDRNVYSSCPECGTV